MAIDYNLILGGQSPDIVGAMSRGNALAGQVMQQDQARQTRDLYKTQGAGISQGDPNALNALAGIDPATAMDLRAGKQRMDIMSAQEQRAIQEFSARASAEEKAAAVQQIEDAVKMGTGLPDEQTWDMVMAREAPELVGQFAMRDALARKYMTMAEAIRAGQGGGVAEVGLQPVFGRDAKGNTVIMQLGKDGRAVATALPEGVTPDLAIAAQERAMGTAIGKQAGTAQMEAPSAIAKGEEALSLIQQIAEDEALPSITGMIQGRIQPLTQAGTDLNVKIEQLQGKVFLEAFESLKGGGAITEVEGIKAEKAIARLNRAQSASAYKAALDELATIIAAGVDRAKSRLSATPQGGSTGVPAGVDAELWNEMTPEERALFQ